MRNLLAILTPIVAIVSLADPFVKQCLAAQAPTARESKGINEEMFVPVGGIEQWITIKGRDRNNPVVLILHGGPGDPDSPIADARFKVWERDFTRVTWDQRGAGRTYIKNEASIGSTLTVERMVQDGIEVAEYLTQRLGKKKIVILGGSWGSILGVQMAHARPDLLYAYVGLAQIVNMQKDVSASYARLLELARASGDHDALAELTANGPPPWNSIPRWSVFQKWLASYQQKRADAPAPEIISPSYRSPSERAKYLAAEDFSQAQFFGPMLSGPLMQVDLPALGTEFEIPIFLIQGQEDLVAIPQLSREYFNAIRAPRKQFYSVPHAAHEPSVREWAVARKVLVSQVRPLALGR